MKKQTKLEVRLEKIVELIGKCKRTSFTRGSVFSVDVIATVNGIEQPILKGNPLYVIKNVTSYNLKMIGIQSLFNKVLNPLGLYMAKRGFYYKILTVEETESKIVTMKKQSKNKRQRAEILAIGLKNSIKGN